MLKKQILLKKDVNPPWGAKLCPNEDMFTQNPITMADHKKIFDDLEYWSHSKIYSEEQSLLSKFIEELIKKPKEKNPKEKNLEKKLNSPPQAGNFGDFRSKNVARKGRICSRRTTLDSEILKIFRLRRAIPVLTGDE